MNSHQRRVHIRRLHMRLPLRAEVDLKTLLGRGVYSYRHGENFMLHSGFKTVITSATVSRHVRPFNRIDIKLIGVNKDTGATEERMVCTPNHGLRLKNIVDRQIRPWWAETRRRHEATGK